MSTATLFFAGTGALCNSMAAGDLDGDGRTDLLLSSSGGVVQVLHTAGK